ncbi:hypothetical protein D3C86_1325490 [compost metagenome]
MARVATGPHRAIDAEQEAVGPFRDVASGFLHLSQLLLEVVKHTSQARFWTKCGNAKLALLLKQFQKGHRSFFLLLEWSSPQGH